MADENWNPPSASSDKFAKMRAFVAKTRNRQTQKVMKRGKGGGCPKGHRVCKCRHKKRKAKAAMRPPPNIEPMQDLSAAKISRLAKRRK